MRVKETNLKVEVCDRASLDEFILHVFRVEFHHKLEFILRIRGEFVMANLLIKSEPGGVLVLINVLDAKVPHLSKADRPDYLIEEILASGPLEHLKLKLRLRGCNLDFDLLKRIMIFRLVLTVLFLFRFSILCYNIKYEL